jgi:hypothetical protein
MAENHISTRPPITRKPHRCQADEDLVARFICHANSTLHPCVAEFMARSVAEDLAYQARFRSQTSCTILPSCRMQKCALAKTPDSPGRNTGLSRKKYRTLQEETPDSPGRNTGLSRKKHRTLQEEIPDSPGRNTGLSREYAIEFSCKP